MLSRKITRVFFFLNKMVQSPRKEANARTTVKYKSCRSIAQISVFHTSKSEFQYDISLKKCKIKNKNKIGGRINAMQFQVATMRRKDQPRREKTET